MQIFDQSVGPGGDLGVRVSLDVFAGFGIRGFRSFGGDAIVRFGPMSQVHLIVGRNNVGKSNAMRALHDVVSQISDSGDIRKGRSLPSSLDISDDWPPGQPIEISIGLYLDGPAREDLLLDDRASALEPILRTEAFSRGNDGVAWFDFLVGGADAHGPSTISIQPSTVQLDQGLRESGVGADVLAALSSALVRSSGDTGYNYRQIMSRMAPWRLVPTTHWVDAVREVTNLEADGDSGARNGRGLVQDIALIQDPDHHVYAESSARFKALQRFIQDVLEDPTARVQVPRSNSTILVHTRTGKVLPIEHLGTGVSEVVMLAATAARYSDAMVCIEEPELHLHPALQRKLIEHLATSTQNRYLITTHSAAMLNADLSSISHVSMEDSVSISRAVFDHHNLSRAVTDLGNRPADLLLANYVIWVEGPSDRQYLSYWISQTDARLVEGAHFVVMFYGGALLSHLSFDDDEATDFIRLMRINRNVAVLIDSDRETEGADLNETKRRVLGEVESVGGYSWVTSGYTIENYVPDGAIRAAIAASYPNRSYRVPPGAYVSPLGSTFEGSATRPSKTVIARSVVASGISVGEFVGVSEMIQPLVDRILESNGMAPRQE